MNDTTPAPSEFTKSLAEFESIIREFDRDQVDLEQGIPKFKRGNELARLLLNRLSQIENEIKEIKAEFADLEEQSATPSDSELSE
ncbi:exodeoxyribonuclease VII small subunit [candidate division WWE3 bacterium]|nr:exodeoxyribonuclease VII small subunit [candidate division WWE3 bacterium]